MDTQDNIIIKCVELVNRDHGDCDENTCDISIALRNGFDLWAIHLWSGSGASCEVFDKLFSQLDADFFEKAEKEREQMCQLEHVYCPYCNAVIWLPNEVNFYCDSCGKKV